MNLRGEFDEAELWESSYRRNNKKANLKNLRCFPACSNTGHVAKGFCGRPIVLRIARQGTLSGKSKPRLFAWGMFKPSEGLNNEPEDPDFAPFTVRLNDVVTVEELQERTKSSASKKEGPDSSPYHEGIIVDSGQERTSPSITFVFNGRKKGWNYGWSAVARKGVKPFETLHAFCAYIFVELEAEKSFKCVGVFESPKFSLVCRKRQLPMPGAAGNGEEEEEEEEEEDALEGLTSHLFDRSSLGLPSEMLTTPGAYGKTMPHGKSATRAPTSLKRPRSPEPKPGGVSKPGPRLAPKSATTTTTTPSNLLKGATKRSASARNGSSVSTAGGGAGSRGSAPGAPEWTNSFRITLPSELPQFGATAAPSVARTPATPGSADAIRRVALVLETVDAILRSDESENTFAVPRFAIDTFLDDVQFILQEFEDDEFVAAAALSNKGASDETESLAILPLEREVENEEDENEEDSFATSGPVGESRMSSRRPSRVSLASSDDGGSSVNSHSGERLLGAMARHFLEESSLAQSIHRIIGNDRDRLFDPVSPFSPESRRNAFLDVMSDQIQSFLDAQGVTMAFFDEALRSVPRPGGGGAGDSSAAAFARWDNHVRRLVEEERNAALTSPRRGYMALFPVLSSPRRVLSAYVDLTGAWRYDTTAREAHERLRRDHGVPYMLRRLTSYAESELSVAHDSEELAMHFPKGIISRQLYVLDGASHPWRHSLPIPWAPLCEFYRAWVDLGPLGDGHHGSTHIVHEYSSSMRSTRVIRKSQTGDRLEINITFERLVHGVWNLEWTERGYALRMNEAV